ncbi:hypothetical protein L6452_38220 [Arctium lappa]|uniref:Uncharacterized protein n=1 Tax=Arctium lappa TaxID=4217 RepID=A0ACB8Y5S1_ARCLA|nr:hypothetical protein L6452_38220 [Arctium lappa]
MVHTIHTRAVSRGRRHGRGRGARRTPYGLGPNRGSFASHRSSTRHVYGHHARRDSPIHARDTPSRESIRQENSLEPSEEYTPRTPTREDMAETIETLRSENDELRERLTQTLNGNTRLRGWLNNLQQIVDRAFTRMISCGSTRNAPNRGGANRVAPPVVRGRNRGRGRGSVQTASSSATPSAQASLAIGGGQEGGQ